MHFTLRQLQAFVAVADTSSFSRAAEFLHLSASAVSQLVIELELVLGYKLFDRSTRKVTLSTAGRAFMPSVEAVLRQLETARATAVDIRDQAAGLLRVAAPLVVASVMLPQLIAAFRSRHSNVTVRLIDCPVDMLVQKVASREADLAMGPDRPTAPEVERVSLFTSPWVVWCAPTHRFARMRAITWADLGKSELVAAGRDHEIHLASMMRNFPDATRAAPQQVVDNISTALGLAAAGLCYTISPAYVESLALPLGLVKREIQDPVQMREMSLFKPTDRELSVAASKFAAYVEATFRSAPAPYQETRNTHRRS
jgi:DNA-binding transcriptional LysR family regulator